MLSFGWLVEGLQLVHGFDTRAADGMGAANAIR